MKMLFSDEASAYQILSQLLFQIDGFLGVLDGADRGAQHIAMESIDDHFRLVDVENLILTFSLLRSLRLILPGQKEFKHIVVFDQTF